MRNGILVLCCLLLGCAAGYAQEQVAGKEAKQYISFELGKTGLIYNLSYDHRLKNSIGFRAVIGSNFGHYLTLYTGGAGVYKLFGGGKKYFELGADLFYLYVDEVSDDQKGVNLVYPDYSIKTIHATVNMGYRAVIKKTMFRIGISPGFIKNKFLPGAYISLGVGLK